MMKLVVFAAVAAVALGASFSGDPKTAQILRQDSDISPDGSYQYGFETDNGIAVQSTGTLGQSNGPDPPAVNAAGSFQYTAPDGQVIQTSYVANENGFQAQGNGLPTPPPIPIAIQRSLEYNEAHPAPPEPQSGQASGPAVKRY
ncbi:hypothetical protein NQ315_001402 [Exocentrus adspersus]|uniref:Uncharacterized protein n=1 Tax=Exocentrus adspersus TaxID=1586481 RepID=A0AAV8WFK8_9CUCU|nr:hypothetical protein NQ315_001402 [Exocentrus adspersus]